MKIIKTQDLTPASMALMSQTELLYIYNGLDCCVTVEVFHEIEGQLDNQTRATYEFSKALQAPILEMKLRGILVDQSQRLKTIAAYEKDLNILKANLERIFTEGIGRSFNWNSPAQMKELFYGILGLPPIKKRNAKGIYAPTLDRNALEALDSYFIAQPICSHLLGLRDIAKKIGVLKTDIDPDGRMRSSFNIGGTSTGRLSSSLSDFGTGGNLQNLEERLRRPFVADPGYKFAYVDLEQAESRLVGAIEWNLFKDGRYLDACESGDLHTTVCKLAWRALPWTGELHQDKGVAERPFYRQHSYRHMAKVLGHGTNYNGKPYTMAKHTKLDAKLIADFQSKYFAAFPVHQRWHAAVASRLLTDGNLSTLTGRRRWFFGRRNDDATIREAIAYDPQGSVADILNRGMLNLWRANICQILIQIHDALLIQYPEHLEDTILPKVLNLIKVPIELNHGRTLLIPAEAQSGWNWSKFDKDNPNGLRKWQMHDERKRQEIPSTKLEALLLCK